MSNGADVNTPPAPPAEPKPTLPSRRVAFKLFRRMFIYHLSLAIVLITLAMVFPGFSSQLPIGGVTELVESGDLTVNKMRDIALDDGDVEIVKTVINTTSEFDRLGYINHPLNGYSFVSSLVWRKILPQM